MALLFLVCFLEMAAGEEKIGKHTSLGMVFYFKTDQDRALEEFYSLGSQIKLQTKPRKPLKFRLKLDAGTDAIRVEEVWGEYEFKDDSLRCGTFENRLLREDHLKSREALFAVGGYIRSRLKEMGWYTDNSLGLRYTNLSTRIRKTGGYSELFFNSNSSEMLMTAEIFYSHAGKDSFLGVSGAYYPHFVHNMWGDSSLSLSSPRDNGYYQDHYVLFNAFIGDMNRKKRLLYKLEYTAGNNLNDPIGYIQYPGEGDVSWFLGMDFYGGYLLDVGSVEWTPAVNVSFFIHDLSAAEAHTTVVRMGNRVAWEEDIYLHLDLGLEINTHYRSDGRGGSELTTGLEALCGIALRYIL